ncbi:14948_t:CDS:2, partial [Funneliformis caledonium]
MVEYDRTQAIREVTITKVPPILQIHVQRVQFDRTTSNIYKSNAYLRFDKVIYLDRYLEKNYDVLKQKRIEAHNWKQEIDKMQEELKDYEQDK